LIYIDELVAEIWKIIKEKSEKKVINIAPTTEAKVSELLTLLESFKLRYFENYIIPELKNKFELNLFNTFRSHIDHAGFFPVALKTNNDNRGTFVEVIKSLSGGQFSFSSTRTGVTRGNHFHTRKIERFIVIKGKAIIRLRKIGTDDILEFELNGEKPSFVDMPVWYTHNITNVGDNELLTLFWINEFFDPEDDDTFFSGVAQDN
jgi:UDP-2-acetamido-2,6-beta-L-arabino-hexul-4-ose reductase